jgi:hypothetical protein
VRICAGLVFWQLGNGDVVARSLVTKARKDLARPRYREGVRRNPRGRAGCDDRQDLWTIRDRWPDAEPERIREVHRVTVRKPVQVHPAREPDGVLLRERDRLALSR